MKIINYIRNYLYIFCFLVSTTIITCGIVNYAYSQIFYTQGEAVYIGNNALLFCNGGVSIENGGQLINNGVLTSTIQSTFAHAGDFHIGIGSTSMGDGIYRIEQDWINDGTFLSQNSSVELYGNKQQFILSNTATNTTFNDLVLLGNGSGIDRRKTLLNVDVSVNTNGVLYLNDRELHTGNHLFRVNNTNPNAIQHSNIFKDEGFVSSLGNNGFLVRATDQASNYLFPVGSSDGERRYRPVEINPNTTDKQIYRVRMNNHSADLDNYFLVKHNDPIEKLNSLFYHSIQPESNTYAPDITVLYITSDDGTWTNLGYWSPVNLNWNEFKSNSIVTSNFEAMYAQKWNFTDNSEQYVLVNSTKREDMLIFIPNSFTPDDNAINDGFHPIIGSGVDIHDYSFQIYNRWGETIFKTNDSNHAWDGKYKGSLVETGTYSWTLYVKTDNSAKKQMLTGHVNLLK